MNGPEEQIELELAFLIRRLTTSAKSIGKLDRSAYLLLHQISAHGSAGVKALAEEARLDISTVSRQTTALEQKGYVYRIPDPADGRAYRLQLTEAGSRALKETKEARVDRLTRLLKDWKPEDREELGRLLGILNQTYLD